MMITGEPLLSNFDAYFESDHGLHLNNQRLARWYSKIGHCYLDQPAALHQPRFLPNHLNYAPAVDFHNWQWMEFKNLGALNGPHTFVVVWRPESGLLFDCQRGPLRLSTLGLPREWQVLQFVTSSAVPLNGACTLGSNYYGTWSFLNGQVAMFAYKQGILSQAQSKYVIETLQAKYNIRSSECDTWYLTLWKKLKQPWISLIKR